MTEKAVRARRDAIRAEYMDGGAEAAEAEALKNSQAVLSVRVLTARAEALKMCAAEQQHVRRERTEPVLIVEQVEEIARRVVRGSA